MKVSRLFLILLCILTAGCAYNMGKHLDPWIGNSAQSLRFSWGTPTFETDSTWTYVLRERTIVWHVRDGRITNWQEEKQK